MEERRGSGRLMEQWTLWDRKRKNYERFDVEQRKRMKLRVNGGVDAMGKGEKSLCGTVDVVGKEEKELGALYRRRKMFNNSDGNRIRENEREK